MSAIVTQPPRTLSQIKNDFIYIIYAFTVKEFDIKLKKSSLDKNDVLLFSTKVHGSYYFNEEFFVNGILDHQKLKDFIHENIAEFSFYQPDVV